MTAAMAAIAVVRMVLLAWAVELSQLLSWPWLQDLRGTRLGALVLGQGFQWADLIAYAIGVSAVTLLDAACFGRRVARP